MQNKQATALFELSQLIAKCGITITVDQYAQNVDDVDECLLLARSALGYLCDPIDGESFEPLDLEVFRSDRGVIVDVTFTVGGPTITARYESRLEEITITASWGCDRVAFRTKEGPLVEWVKDYVEIC